MKKFILLFSMLSFISIISCNNRDDKTTKTEEHVTTVTVTPENPPPAQKEEDGTSIKVNDEGVSYSNKDGDNESKVKISEDSSSIEIRKPK